MVITVLLTDCVSYNFDEIEPRHALLKLPDDKPWRRMSSGISLLGICRTSTCDAHRKEVIISIGHRKFNVLVDTNASTAKCPVCGRYVETLKLGFYRCHWRVSGTKQITQQQAPFKFSENWSHAHGCSLVEYNLQDGTIWRELIVEAKAENSN